MSDTKYCIIEGEFLGTISSNVKSSRGLEGYLELELEESSKPDEAETDCDGYLRPVDFLLLPS